MTASGRQADGEHDALPPALRDAPMSILFARMTFPAAGGPGTARSHGPALMWLAASLRPAQVVTLGAPDGVAHFAACQVVERQGQEGAAISVAAYPGGRVPAALTAYSHQHYREISTLRAGDPLGAARHIAAGIVDLLMIDAAGCAIAALETAGWTDRLSPRAVVAVWGMDRDAVPDALPLALRAAPRFDFVHGGGLTVIGVGDDLPAGVLAMLDAASRRGATMAWRRVFARLGAAAQADATAPQAALPDRGPPDTDTPDTDLPDTDLPEADLLEADLLEAGVPDTDLADTVTMLHDRLARMTAIRDADALRIAGLEDRLGTAHREAAMLVQMLEAIRTPDP